MLVQRFEDGKIRQRLPSGFLEVAEALSEAALCRCIGTKLSDLKAPKQCFQYWPLTGRDGTVINHLGRARGPAGGPEPLSLHQRVHARILGETGYRGWVDVKTIEINTAGGRIRADVQRFSCEQCMKRVDAKRRCSR